MESAAQARDALEELAVYGNRRFRWFLNTGAGYYLRRSHPDGRVIRWGLWSNHRSMPAVRAIPSQTGPGCGSFCVRQAADQRGAGRTPALLNTRGILKPGLGRLHMLSTIVRCRPLREDAEGQIPTQRDAQLDQFRACYRKACD